MPKIRVLVVEDSLTVRKRLAEILISDPDIEVIGEAADGRSAIEICNQRRPDLITMDMMMPVMNGLSATEHIMAHFPTPILVVSASTNRGELFKIYESLAAGAVDVMEKPLGTDVDAAWEHRFLAAAKLVARIRVVTHPRALLAARNGGAEQPTPRLRSPANGASKCSLVAIGASTGGPGAIVQVLRDLPPAFQTPILVVLHINESFGSAFADWLDGQIGRRVAYPDDGAPLASAIGRVAVAPAGRHLTVRDGRFRLTLERERHSCRPSIDVLFESVAAEYGAAAAACLLTGMGRDGALGLLRIREAGGMTIAQDESTSVIYGMPREAARLGAAAEVLRLGDIGPRLASLQGVPSPSLEIRP
jgi:two-component system chemotaxis response regulator CheB